MSDGGSIAMGLLDIIAAITLFVLSDGRSIIWFLAGLLLIKGVISFL